MSVVPMPTGIQSLARQLAELRAEVRRPQGRRLGQSAITSGTLEVESGAAIRIKSGARLIVEDGGALTTGNSGGRKSIEVAPAQITNTYKGLSTEWAEIAVVNLPPPVWAASAALSLVGHVQATQLSEGVGDVKARLVVQGAPTDFEALIPKSRDGATALGGVPACMTVPAPPVGEHLQVSLGIHSAGALAEARIAATISGSITWLAGS